MSAVTKLKPRRNIIPSPSARWAKGYRNLDKDPDLDLVRQAMHDSGLPFKEIAARSGVSVGTLIRWDYGDVKRPQNITMKYVMLACGWEHQWRRIKG